MRRPGLLALVLAAAWAAPSALAQQLRAEPAATERCLMPLQPDLGQPEYPFELWKSGAGGRVLVELEFRRPDAAPRVTVLERLGDVQFVEAVRDHVGKLRVPCLEAADAPARLRQDYSFKPDRRLVASPVASNPDNERNERLTSCVMHVSGDRTPAYSATLRRRGTQGRVVARLRFEASDKPPQTEVLARRNARELAREVEDFVAGYRMPCHEGSPVRSYINFVFRLEGEAYGFKDLTFVQWVRAIKNLNLQRVDYDTTKMGCPFDVRLQYFQPLQRNLVWQLGDFDAAREPLLHWLRDSSLDLPERQLDAVFGDTIVLTVPCVRIDLKPKE